jgi:DNA-binding transcriptional ArsR family regulator
MSTGPNRRLRGGKPPHPSVTESVKAIGSPHRRRLLRILHVAGEARSPNEMSEALGVPVSHISYHVKVLKSCRVIALTDTQPRRGAVEHFYASTIADNPLMGSLLEATQAEDEAKADT